MEWDGFDRGKLLYEQPAPHVKREAKSRKETLRLVVIVLVFATGFILSFTIMFMSMGFLLFGVPVALLLIFAVGYLLLALRQPEEKPTEKIYEEGFTEVTWRGEEVFIPWSAVPTWEAEAKQIPGWAKGLFEGEIPEDGAYRKVTVKGLGSNKSKVIGADHERADEIVRALKARVGRGGPMPEGTARYLRRHYRSQVIGSLLGGTFLGAFFTTFFVAFAQLPWDAALELTLLCALPISTAFFGVMIVFGMTDLWALPRGVDLNTLPALSLAMLTAPFFVVLAVTDTASSPLSDLLPSFLESRVAWAGLQLGALALGGYLTWSTLRSMRVISSRGPPGTAREERVDASMLEPEEALPAWETPPNRGEMLWRAPSAMRDSVRLRLQSVQPWHWTLVILVAVVVYFVLNPVDAFGLLIGSVFAMSFLPIMLLILREWRFSSPVLEVYENGLVLGQVVGRGRFVPFSEFSDVVERADFGRYGEAVIEGSKWKARFERRTRRYDELVVVMRERVGKRRYGTPDPRDAPLFTFRRLLAGVLVLCVSIALVVTYFLLSYGIELPNIGLAGEVALYMLVCGVYIFPFLMSWVLSRARTRRYELDRRRNAIITTLVGVVLLLGTAGLMWAFLPEMLQDHPVALANDEPLGVYLEVGEYVGETLVVDGPVTVRSGETMVLRDCSLVFDPGGGTSYGVWVGEGGRLELHNTTVDTVDAQVGYSFEVHGSALIAGSTINHTSRKEGFRDLDSGVEVYGDDVVIRNTTFNDARHNSVSVYESAPTISGCTFVRAKNAGVSVVRGDPVIRHCVFWNCHLGVNLEDTKAIVEDCTFERNEWGVVCDWGSPVVRGCTFQYTTNASIEYTESKGVPLLEGNTFLGGGEDVDRKAESVYFQLMFVLVFFTLPLLLIYSFAKELRKKETVTSVYRDDEGNIQIEEKPVEDLRAKLECPRCGTVLEVPYRDPPASLECPGCGMEFRFRREDGDGDAEDAT